MDKILTPSESSEFIIKRARFVKVQPSGIAKLSEEIIKGLENNTIHVSNFCQQELHPRPSDQYAINWIFLVDTLNFCFWTPNDHTKYKVNGYTGYFALCAAVNRAIKDGVDFTNPSVFATLDEKELQYIFRSDDGQTEIPLLKERFECLQEVGGRLLNRWEGKFENVIKAANGSAVKLLQMIITEFPSFRDDAIYDGQRVALYKRAQILIGDIWACFQGTGLGEFHDLECITMFADYRIPQVLVHFGCLEYSPELKEILQSDTILESGHPMEVEIRGASIYIVEKVKVEVRKVWEQRGEKLSSSALNSILIDHFLWDYRRQHIDELNHIPFHKVKSIYY